MVKPKRVMSLYNVSKTSISEHTKKIIENNELSESAVRKFRTTGIDGKTYNIKYYNQDIVLTIGYRIKSNRVYTFKDWFESLVKENKDNLNNQLSNNLPIFSGNYEVIKFVDGKFNLDVNVSPSEETVWLNANEIALLFDRDIKTINKHISNALSEECDGSTVANFATVQQEGSRYVNRIVSYYNLDMIISIGYRVNSKRGALFF